MQKNHLNLPKITKIKLNNFKLMKFSNNPKTNKFL